MGKISKNELNESLKYEIENAGSNIEIVNDFSGGIDKVASAELAKTLNTNQVTTNTQLAQIGLDVQNHLQQQVSDVLFVERDLSLTGLQTIPTAKKIKTVTIFGRVLSQTTNSQGFWGNGTQAFNSTMNDGAVQTALTKILRLGANISNFTQCEIKNITANSFDLDWTKAGSPTGASKLCLLLTYHGED